MSIVSIVIPAYNNAKFLPEAIESVLDQTYKDYEIIVVDDGSTDNTKEVLAPYFDKIKYIQQQNQGAGNARNTGIRHSQGEYIAFLDADDVWLPEKLHIQINYLNNNPRIAMVYSLSYSMSEDGKQIKKKGKWGRTLPSENLFDVLFLHNIIPTSTVVVRNEVFNTIGLFDESLINSQDRDLWLRIARELNVAGISKLLSKYRHTSGSLRKNKGAIEFIRRVIEKHYKLSIDLGRPISTTLYKKALARSFFRAGKRHLRAGDKEKALENFFLSLKYSAFNFRTIKYFFITYIKNALGYFTTPRVQKEKQ
jgi:glycosyltransferase involved in cell wall biosynthesis